jgi:hypothetical protein
VAIRRQTGHRLGQARALVTLGHVLYHTGGTGAALPCWQQGLALFTDIGAPDADQVRDLLRTQGSDPVEGSDQSESGAAQRSGDRRSCPAPTGPQRLTTTSGCSAPVPASLPTVSAGLVRRPRPPMIPCRTTTTTTATTYHHQGDSCGIRPAGSVAGPMPTRG